MKQSAPDLKTRIAAELRRRGFSDYADAIKAAEVTDDGATLTFRIDYKIWWDTAAIAIERISLRLGEPRRVKRED